MKLRIKIDKDQSRLISNLLIHSAKHNVTMCEFLILEEMKREKFGKFCFAEKTQTVSFRMSEAFAIVSALDSAMSKHDDPLLWATADGIKNMILPKMPSSVFS